MFPIIRLTNLKLKLFFNVNFISYLKEITLILERL